MGHPVLSVPLWRTIRDDPAALGRPCRAVVERRLGLSGHPESNADIAASLGVTKQRVHQLSVGGISAFEASTGWPGLVRRRLSSISPFTLERLLEEPWAPAAGGAWALAVLNVACGADMRRMPGDGVALYAILARGGWREAVDAVVAGMVAPPSRTHESDLAAACATYVGPGNGALASLLAAEIRASETGRGARRPAIHDAVDHVMRNAQVPLHPFDVLHAVEARLVRNVSLPRVQARLAEAHDRDGSGRYVLGR